MKASEVLSRYAAGERDFRRANLRGQSFKKQNLAGADFSGADIRGANFAQAQLQGANFTRAVAGVQRRWVVGQLLLLLVIAALAGVLQIYFAHFIDYFFPHWWDPSYNWDYFAKDLATTIAYCIIPVTFTATACQGFTAGSVITLAIASVVTVAFAGVEAVAVAVIFAVIFTAVFAIALGEAVVDTSAFVFAIALGEAVVAANAVAAAVRVAVAKAIVSAETFAGVVADAVGVSVSVGITVAILLMVLYCSRRALRSDEKFELRSSFGIAFAALGGTRFYGSDLTGANFTGAVLKSTNFRAATLTHVCWHTAQKLDCARVGNSILTNAAVLELLTSRNGYKKSYVDANLRGADLNGVNLNAADLKLADLSEATLQQANLRDANLREVLAIGTDFTEAYLTGACLEAWDIDHTTKLNGVDCQYIFLLEHPTELGSRERRPHDPDEVFKPGDFEKLYSR
jgi:uncharacterized protein YjbI with pentapeptide repeats